MSVRELLGLLKKAQQEGQLRLADAIGNLRAVVSFSIRIDDDGQTFIVLHDERAAKPKKVPAETK